MSGGYAVASTQRSRRIPRITGANTVNRARPIQTTTMKLSIKERLKLANQENRELVLLR